jgi:hypothetical protein
MNIYFLDLVSTSKKERRELTIFPLHIFGRRTLNRKQDLIFKKRKTRISKFRVDLEKLVFCFMVGGEVNFFLEITRGSRFLCLRINQHDFYDTEHGFSYAMKNINLFSPLKMNLIKRNIIGFYNMILD